MANKIYRWILYLETLGFSYREVKGCENILAADVCFMKRLFYVFKSSDFLLQQCNDENLSKIIECAKVIKNILKEFKRYIDNL